MKGLRSRQSGMLAVVMLGLLLAAAAAAVTPNKVLVIGFDGMDPNMLAEYRAQGLMPNFDRFIDSSSLP